MTVCVVGAGAAGLMAAITAARAGHGVLLLEKNMRPGRKLLVTGKGRCNITNDCDADGVQRGIRHGGRFLMSALSRFTPRDVMVFFEELGLPLKVERGGRVFPVSDRAMDVVDALARAASRAGVRTHKADVARLLIGNGEVRGVADAAGREFAAERVIVCCGGLSYSATGCTGAGYELARQAGHAIVPTRASLVPLIACEAWCGALAGLTLKNVSARLTDTRTGRTLYREQGELLFTHDGISGPLTLSMSAHIDDDSPERYEVDINLKPALSREQLDARVLRDFSSNLNRELRNSLDALVPRSLIPVIVRLSGIVPDKRVHDITKSERAALVDALRAMRVTVRSLGPLEQAVVTAGGVATKDIAPGTMESKLVRGLRFAGEVLDCDGYTGGFNLQIAWATGAAAGRGQ